MNGIQPSIVKKWDVKDRGDGVELRVEFNDGSQRKLNIRDGDVWELIETLEGVVGSHDRPVTEGENVR